jgi:hypothetical protein
VGPIAATTEAEEDINGGPLGVLLVGPVAATTAVEESIDGGPLLLPTCVLIPTSNITNSSDHAYGVLILSSRPCYD